MNAIPNSQCLEVVKKSILLEQFLDYLMWKMVSKYVLSKEKLWTIKTTKTREI